MADWLGNFNTASSRTTVRFAFSTHAATGAPVAPSSAFENADLLIYKDAGATQRSSASGITMTSPFDSVTGLHFVSIDLTDNTDAGFYAAGSHYTVVLSSDETVDSLAVLKVLCYFEIGPQQTNVVQVSGTTQTAGDLAALINTVDDFLDTEIAALTTNLATANTNINTIDDFLDTEIAALTTNLATANTNIVTIDDLLDTEIAALTTNLATANTNISTLLTNVNTIDDFLDTEIAALTTNLATANTNINTIDDFLDTEIAALTSNLATANANIVTIDDFLDTEIAALTTNLATANTNINTIDDFLDTEIAAIKAVTDNLASAANIADVVWDEAIAGHASAGSTGAALSAATAPSAAAVADAVWDEVLSGHLTAGSTGDALNSAGGGGSTLYGEDGSVTFTYTVYDTNGSTPLAGCTVYVSSDVNGVYRSQTKLTDSLGRVVFDLDPGTVYFWRTYPGRTFVNPDTENVS